MNAKEILESIGMEVYKPNHLLFEFTDGRDTYVFFNEIRKEVETCYKIHEFHSKEEFKLFKKAIDKYTEELGWL